MKIKEQKNYFKYTYLLFALSLILCACQSEKEKETAPEVEMENIVNKQEIFDFVKNGQTGREIAEKGRKNLESVRSVKGERSVQLTGMLSDQLIAAASLVREGVLKSDFGFVIDTGGEDGEYLITARLCEVDKDTVMEGVQCWYEDEAIKISVWKSLDTSEPMQTMVKYVERFHYEDGVQGNYEILDANFDGYMDFAWLCHSGNQPRYYYLWIWNEEEQKFVEEPVYNEISCPVMDADGQIILGWSRNSAADDGDSTFYRWIDRKLTCVRKISVWQEFGAEHFIMTVEDNMNGEMVEVYRGEFKEYEFDAEREKWSDLNYYEE
jgi:hypothetical protein